MVPEDEPIDKVDGSPVALQVNGELPPVAATGALYAVPVEPLDSEVVVMVRAAAIVNWNCLLAV
jgi:hypothetical protein